MQWGNVLAIWVALAVLAVANGILREKAVKPRTGERWAHLISTLVLSVVILVVSVFSLPWTGAKSLTAAWEVGALWTGLTLAFEFFAGHYLFGNPWSKILADYDPTHGRVWMLVPVVTLFGPPLAFVGVPAQFAVPYAVSQVFAVVTLAFAFGRPKVARWVMAALFSYAAVHNALFAVFSPQEYQGFASMMLVGWYREIVEGPFRTSATAWLAVIALGQAIVALCLAMGGQRLWVGVAGVIVFLVALLPFGVGSAFPFGVVVSLAALVVYGVEVEAETGLRGRVDGQRPAFTAK
ncbi:MAG: hypothetical protein JSS65_14035 [Armatimonadetes bacterium]|nr:hypothetical protein [Armatimonadota bacterium]